MGNVNVKFKMGKRRVGKKTLMHPGYLRSELGKFNPDVLGIGNIAAKSKQIDAIAAAFDLSGFTRFCSQVDPHLSLPRFLNSFLGWLFDEIKSELEIKAESEEDRLYLWTELPFFAKFTGDGVMFLWDAENMSTIRICNIVVSMDNICGSYHRKFVPGMKKHLSHVPIDLRCGVARGMVCTVGKGGDYVGPCINIASRLQKLSSMRICISLRGIDFEEGMGKETAEKYTVKSVPIRGIGEGELVIVDKEQFEKLPKRDKEFFGDT
jgi:hypothetical protein